MMRFSDPVKVLFVCSRNQWRSPTGEAIFRKNSDISVRSAGTSASAKRRLSVSDIDWADVILVMEETHKSRIKEKFRNSLRGKTLHVLDIPDEYSFMEPELIEILRMKATPLLQRQ